MEIGDRVQTDTGFYEVEEINPAYGPMHCYHDMHIVVPVEHKIRHFVHVPRADDVSGSMMIPRETSMRGEWPCDAKCSCGWGTKTGGAVRSYIDKMVASHKFDVKHGFWKPTS